MRVETNQKLAYRNKQIAQGLFFVSFAVLIISFIVINQPLFNPTAQIDNALVSLLSLVVLPIGLVLTLISVRMTNLWIRLPRPEVAIREGLKGLSNKSVLYNYYHFPARHVLLCPQGVFAMVTRFQEGSYTVQGDQWRANDGIFRRITGIFRLDSVRNPTLDALKAAENVQKLITPIAPDVKVQPLVIFVDGRAKLEIIDPIVPVLYADDRLEPNLKEYLRQQTEKKISPKQLATLAEAFESATLPEPRKPRQVVE